MKTKLILLGLFFLTVLILAYANHFDNGFYFDDVHTIVNNEYIRDISNIPTFFTDLASFGTMPNNRGYRPMVTTLNAIDYWMGGNKLDPFYFHLSIFFWYIVQCVLMFFIFKKMFDLAFKHRWNTSHFLERLTMRCIPRMPKPSITSLPALTRSPLFASLHLSPCFRTSDLEECTCI
jgi:hypothetical protein